MMIIVIKSLTLLTRIDMACWHDKRCIQNKMIKLSPWKYLQNRQSHTCPMAAEDKIKMSGKKCHLMGGGGAVWMHDMVNYCVVVDSSLP